MVGNVVIVGEAFASVARSTSVTREGEVIANLFVAANLENLAHCALAIVIFFISCLVDPFRM